MIGKSHNLPIALLAALGVMLMWVSACAEKSTTDLDYLRVVVDGQDTLGVSQKGHPPKAVVVYFHGLDADEGVIMSDDKHTNFTTALVDKGYAVVASRAGGNAFGNDASRRNYAKLALSARAHYRVQDVYFVAESMGAIAATSLLAATPDPRLRGLVAISPALNLEAVPPQYRSAVQAAYPTEPVGNADPMNLPISDLIGKNIKLYTAQADTQVDTSTNADAFERKFGRSARISVARCSGDHVDPSCFEGPAVATWFDGLASQ